MGAVVLGTVGRVVGNYFLPGVGGVIGGVLGAACGGTFERPILERDEAAKALDASTEGAECRS